LISVISVVNISRITIQNDTIACLKKGASVSGVRGGRPQGTSGNPRCRSDKIRVRGIGEGVGTGQGLAFGEGSDTLYDSLLPDVLEALTCGVRGELLGAKPHKPKTE
jgi:hypothetical protein